MQEYIGIKVLHGEPMNLGDYNTMRGWDIPHNEDPARPGFHVVYDQGTDAEYPSWSPRDKFEESYVAVEAGTGQMLKAVAAMAMMAAISGSEPTPANDQPTNAELGVLTDDHYSGVASVCWNVVRQWRVNQGSSFTPPWDRASNVQRVGAISTVTAMMNGEPITMGPNGAADLLEISLYRTVVDAILA